MIYMIVRWNGESWLIMHYTPDFDDAVRMHELWGSRFSNVQLLVDVRVLDIHESTLRIKALKKKLQDAKNKATAVANECNSSRDSSGTASVV